MSFHDIYNGGADLRRMICPYIRQAYTPHMRQTYPEIGHPYTGTRQYPGVRQQFSYLRILHASPGTPNVDIYANAALIAANLSYRGFTEYLQLLPGRYNIKVFRAGTTAPVLLDTEVELPVQSINTAVFI